MSWTHANLIFPLGVVPLPDGNTITVKELQTSDIQTVYRDEDHFANFDIERITRWIWGKDGEFAKVDIYDVYNQVAHPDPEHYPLNVFGMQMVNDYISTHNIDIHQYDIDAEQMYCGTCG